ncbi:MAG TPA: mannose-1-phosphate guanylyltransferase/mannose-6-phosphate isomerase [Archaeoglobus sp.]|nr:mannose-1-phosphate guanylyltransferase/mannose-6-phosphate isomerase [Archaeoglobus sp.]
MNVIVLSGGKGTRLFPLSREVYPKQYLKLFDCSLFQMCVKRALELTDEENITIVTNRDQLYIVREQLEELNSSNCNILVEPQSKNTFPAILYGIRNLHGTVCILPSDHFIEGKIAQYFRIAEKYAKDYLITFGIRPTKPHTGYGYIKPGERIGEIFKVQEFVEKPDYKTAKNYVTSGYFWNSGMFVFDADLFREECWEFMPNVMQSFEESVEKGYESCPDISVDQAIMERTKRAAVIPVEINWSDLGSFDSIYAILSKDENGNAIKGEYIGIESSGNLVLTDRLTALIGIENTMVISSDDALLVCKREYGEKVKEIVKRLKGDKRIIHPSTIFRSWGYFTLLTQGDSYWVKKVVIKPKRSLSLHSHYHRSEHWIVVKGTAKVLIGDKEYILRSGESAYVPAGIAHKLENPGIIPLEIVEVAIGEYLNEEDIHLFE